MSGDVDREMKVSTSVETCLSAVDENSGFVVNGAKMQQYMLVTPGFGHGELSSEPGVKGILALDACAKISQLTGDGVETKYN